jgi:hypothetical protein
MLLIGLGIGALASQLGAVTVSAVPDEESPEVGGLQNTATNLGASLGTALAGSILIATLTSSFLTNIEQSSAIPSQVKSQANVQLAGGVPFISDADLKTALAKANASSKSTDAAVDAYSEARIAGLRSALAILALITIVALFLAQRIPTRQPGAVPAEEINPRRLSEAQETSSRAGDQSAVFGLRRDLDLGVVGCELDHDRVVA